MSLTADVDQRIRAGEYDVADALKGASHREVIDVVSFCFLNYDAFLPLILLHSLSVIEGLDKSDWAQVVAKVKSKSPFYLQRFAAFLLGFCRLDQEFLRDIGIPRDKIDELVAQRTHPSFPYRHPSENVRLGSRQQRANAGKLEMFEQAGLSEDDIWRLFNLFTNDHHANLE